MQAHMKAIDSERNRLRQERNDALKAYQGLQLAVCEADERIAIGKSQLQQLGEDYRAVRLENQNLQAQVEALQTDLAVKNKETADAQIRIAEEQKKSMECRTEEVEQFNKLKAKLYAKCDSLRLSLDDIVDQHKSLASKSKQQWDRTLAECQLMNQEIQGNRTAACHLADSVREAHQRSAKIIEQVKDMVQKQGESQTLPHILRLNIDLCLGEARSALLSDQLQEAEDQLRRAEEENNRLRQELEHQQCSNTSLESCKDDIITAMGALQAQFESSQSTQGSDLLTPKLVYLPQSVGTC
jgi:chromosome segregation ATPase